MLRIKPYVLGVAIVVVLLLLTACGTADINVHITYTDSGDTEGKMTIKATGGMANLILASDFKNNLSKDGWNVQTNATNDNTTIVATTKKKRGEQFTLPSTSNNGQTDSAAKDFAFKEEGGLFDKNYELRFKMSPINTSNPPQTQQPQLFDEKQMTQMLQSMFKFSISVTLPGEIVETNADNVQGNTATWYVPIGAGQSANEMIIKTRQMLWTNIAAAGVIVLVVLGAGVFTIIRGRRA